MRTIWRATAYLFWQYPILWLPVILADLIAFSLRSAQLWMRQVVLHSLSANYSVLSDAPEPLRTLPVAWAAIFGTTRAFVELLNVRLYVAAMISISVLIPVRVAETKTPWGQIPLTLKQLGFRIPLLALKILLTLAAAAILDFGLIASLPRLRFLPVFLRTMGSSRDQNVVIAAVLFAAVAWLVAPAAVSLLRPRESPSGWVINLRHARNFAVVCVIASTAVYFLAEVAEPSFAPLLTTAFRVQCFWLMASATSALLYIPLFVALDLIANPELLVAISPAVDHVPDSRKA
jgi:hypothetical protein